MSENDSAKNDGAAPAVDFAPAAAAAPAAPEQELTPVEGVNPRKDALDAIYERRRQQLEKEMGMSFDTPADPSVAATPAEPSPAPQEKIVAVTAAPIQQQQTRSRELTNLPDNMTLDVNGQILEIPSQMVLDLAKQGLNAQQITQHARNEIIAAQNARAEAERMMFNSQRPTAQQQTPQQASKSLISESEAAEINNRLLYGSKDEQVQAIQDLSTTIASRLQASQDSNRDKQFMDAATHNALVALRKQQEQEKLLGEFQDIFSDYALSAAAGAISGNLIQQYRLRGIEKPEHEIWREACNTMRQNYGRKTEMAQANNNPTPNTPPVQAVPSVPVSQERLERKRAAPQPPAAANRVASEAPPQHGAQGSQIVQWMRKQRGQPVY